MIDDSRELQCITVGRKHLRVDESVRTHERNDDNFVGKAQEG